MPFNVEFIADWEAIRMRIHHKIDKNNNNREISLCVDHDYKVGVKVTIIGKDIHRKMNYPTQGP